MIVFKGEASDSFYKLTPNVFILKQCSYQGQENVP